MIFSAALFVPSVGACARALHVTLDAAGGAVGGVVQVGKLTCAAVLADSMEAWVGH